MPSFQLCSSAENSGYEQLLTHTLPTMTPSMPFLSTHIETPVRINLHLNAVLIVYFEENQLAEH